MNLAHLVEELDPGHFGRRRVILEDLREKARSMGFFPLPLSSNDELCFWVSLEPNESNQGQRIHVSRDELRWPSYIDALKEVAKYEKDKQ